MNDELTLQEEETPGGLTTQMLSGEIIRVVYENEDKTYTVFRLVDRQGVEHTVTGNIFGAYAGRDIELSGHWESHPEYGRQFRADSYRFLLPSTPEGITRYLGSGAIPGIGPKNAKSIVDRFGAQTLEILSHSSGRLREVRGLGKKRIEQIRQSWQSHSRQRDIFIFLQGLGISTAFCMRIYRQYGDAAAEKVRANPYQLISDIDGIGFIMADRIAAGLNITKNAPFRIRAGINYTLDQLSAAGHVCYPKIDFLQFATKTLDVPMEEVVAELSCAVSSKQIVIIPDHEHGELVFSRLLYIAEHETSKIMVQLAMTKKFAGLRMAQIKTSPRLALSEEQFSAVMQVCREPLNIITGGPGVGKTTVIGEIVRRAKAAKLKTYMAAPTGRAARRMSESTGSPAQTIHRMLKWDPAARNFVFNAQKPLPCDLLIVDEVSMLDCLLAWSLFSAVKPGTSVILVGDADQLPSVGPGKVLNALIESQIIKTTHLSKIFRQGAGSQIIMNAHRVNAGVPPLRNRAKSELTDFYWIEQDDTEKTLDIIKKLVAERIPKRFGLNPVDDIQILTPMNRGSCGTLNLNAVLQDTLNPGLKPHFKIGERIFKAGDKLMQISNNYEKNVFNGDMGRLAHINFREKKFIVMFDSNQSVEYNMFEADQLSLAYAVTVHKAQGSEFPAVIMPLLSQHHMMLQRNLLYTGMTRAKKLLILIGDRRSVAMAVNNIRQAPRFTHLREFMIEKQQQITRLHITALR